LPSAHQLLLKTLKKKSASFPQNTLLKNKTLKKKSTEAPERADVSEQESGRKT
jgi:hypothetical protein